MGAGTEEGTRRARAGKTVAEHAPIAGSSHSLNTYRSRHLDASEPAVRAEPETLPRR